MTRAQQELAAIAEADRVLARAAALAVEPTPGRVGPVQLHPIVEAALGEQLKRLFGEKR